jgi:hypothetical protein
MVLIALNIGLKWKIIGNKKIYLPNFPYWKRIINIKKKKELINQIA